VAAAEETKGVAGNGEHWNAGDSFVMKEAKFVVYDTFSLHKK
jgi:hypothetical protein